MERGTQLLTTRRRQHYFFLSSKKLSKILFTLKMITGTYGMYISDIVRKGKKDRNEH